MEAHIRSVPLLVMFGNNLPHVCFLTSVMKQETLFPERLYLTIELKVTETKIKI